MKTILITTFCLGRNVRLHDGQVGFFEGEDRVLGAAVIQSDIEGLVRAEWSKFLEKEKEIAASAPGRMSPFGLSPERRLPEWKPVSKRNPNIITQPARL